MRGHRKEPNFFGGDSREQSCRPFEVRGRANVWLVSTTLPFRRAELPKLKDEDAPYQVASRLFMFGTVRTLAGFPGNCALLVRRGIP